MGSSRYPGKALADIGGQPALTRLLRRIRRAERLHEIVLATTSETADDVLAEWAAANELPVYRGSENDVLRRVVEAQRAAHSDIVVEVTGDNILADPELVDLAVDTFLNNECDVVTNAAKHTFPAGMEVQVFTLADLAEVERRVYDPAVREHVSLYFYEHPEQYRIFHLRAPRRWAFPEFRLVLDYREDHLLLNEVFRRLEPLHGDTFGLDEIVALLQAEPQLAELNRGCEERSPR